MAKINIGLTDKNRAAIIKILASHLADQHVLYIKTRNFHWNITGPRFNDLHKFLEEIYTAMAVTIDDTAERIRAVGGLAPGSMKEFLQLARLSETKGKEAHADGVLKALVDDHESMIRQLREDVDLVDDKLGDAGTADFLTAIMESTEKTAWMLRSLLG